MKRRIVVLCIVVLGFPGPAAAATMDGIAVMAGSARHAGTHVTMGRMALQHHWQRHWFERGSWNLTGYWELGLGYWHGRAGMTGNRSLEAVDLRPVFRWQQTDAAGSGGRFYVEAGVGPALLSGTRIEDRHLSTAFQFGSHLGIGIRFGQHRRYELAYRLMHYSNADIKLPNEGMTFNVVQLAARF